MGENLTQMFSITAIDKDSSKKNIEEKQKPEQRKERHAAYKRVSVTFYKKNKSTGVTHIYMDSISPC